MIYVCLPVHDEATTIGPLLWKLRTVLSSDSPVGYGVAVDRLLKHVAEAAPYPKRDAAVVLQADFTEDPAALVDLIKTYEGGADVVAGVTDDPRDAWPRGLRWARRLAPWVLGATHSRSPVADPLCGFRAYRIVVLKKALRDAEDLCRAPEPWLANLELLRVTVPHARRVEEAPLALRYDRLTRPSRFRALHTLRALLRLRGERWTEAPAGEAA